MSQAAENYKYDDEEQGFGGPIETLIPRIDIEAVSYTHLTLPTICSV